MSPIVKAGQLARKGNRVLYVVASMSHTLSLIKILDPVRMIGNLAVTNPGAVVFVTVQQVKGGSLAGQYCPVFIDLLAWDHMSRGDHQAIARCAFDYNRGR